MFHGTIGGSRYRLWEAKSSNDYSGSVSGSVDDPVAPGSGTGGSGWFRSETCRRIRWVSPGVPELFQVPLHLRGDDFPHPGNIMSPCHGRPPPDTLPQSFSFLIRCSEGICAWQMVKLNVPGASEQQDTPRTTAEIQVTSIRWPIGDGLLSSPLRLRSMETPHEPSDSSHSISEMGLRDYPCTLEGATSKGEV